MESQEMREYGICGYSARIRERIAAFKKYIFHTSGGNRQGMKK